MNESFPPYPVDADPCVGNNGLRSIQPIELCPCDGGTLFSAVVLAFLKRGRNSSMEAGAGIECPHRSNNDETAASKFRILTQVPSSEHSHF